MNKQIKIILNLFLILLTIFIPLSFFLKFNKYEEIIIFNQKNDKFLIAQKDTYKKISGFNFLNLLINDTNVKVSVKNNWQEVKDFGYFLKIDLNQYTEIKKAKVFIAKENIYGF